MIAFVKEISSFGYHSPDSQQSSSSGQTNILKNRITLKESKVIVLEEEKEDFQQSQKATLIQPVISQIMDEELQEPDEEEG